LSYLSFGITSTLFGIWQIERQDVVLIESPPLFLVPFALLVAKLIRGKPAMMVSDIWPDIIIRMGHSSQRSLSIKALLWLEKYCYNHSRAVALTNPEACQQIRKRFPNLENVTIIPNGVDTKMFGPRLRNNRIRKEFGAGPKDFLIGYCGLHGLAQGLDVILGAADKLRDRKNIKFVMIGDGPTKDQLVKKAEKMKLSNLTFYDHRPKKEIPAILASFDISLVTLAGRFPGTMPSKIYEALASGTPLIVAKGCEGQALVQQYDAGKCYEPLDSDEMAAAICELAENDKLVKQIKSNCVKLSQRFDRDVISQRTEKILISLATDQSLPEVSW
jgi:glycosyltransferase involved in cell wall biosynthesis